MSGKAKSTERPMKVVKEKSLQNDKPSKTKLKSLKLPPTDESVKMKKSKAVMEKHEIPKKI